MATMPAPAIALHGRLVGRRHRVLGSLGSYAMLAPFLVVYVVFVMLPILYSLFLSLTQWNGITASNFVGVQNYTELAASSNVQKSFGNLFLYVLLDVPVGMVVGLALALFIDRFTRRWAQLLRALIFFPFIIPLFVTALVWTWLLDPTFGFVDQVFGPLGLGHPDWLHNPAIMIPALVIVDVWHSAGFNMLLLLAGLKDISPETIEAAKLDGANSWQEVRFITLPQLRPVFFVVVVNAFISAFQVFDLPWLLTKSSSTQGAGGPSQGLLFPVMEAYSRATGTLQFGQAATLGVALLAVISFVTALLFLIRRRWEDA